MSTLNLSDKSIFESFKCKADNINGQQRSILEIRDGVIFLWDEEEGCIRTQGVRDSCSRHQELRPTEQPEFQVNNISVNESGSRAALWGPEGVSILDLPWRCGPKMEYQNGKSHIVVRCRNIAGLDLGLGATVLQVRWNPTSLPDSAIMILTSDNTLYHFDLMPAECPPIETLRVGSQPFSRQRTLAALGETAVDFCFAPLFVETVPGESTSTAVLILRGDGDVTLLICNGEEEEFPDGQTLPISPLPEEHFLGEACSILAVTGRPPGVAIATSRGVIYHTVLVPLDTDQVDIPLHQRQHRLLVVESVLLHTDVQFASDDVNSFPVKLLADPGHLRRYMALHPSGVHSVVMEILSGVEQLLHSNKSNLNETTTFKKLPESMLEHLICSGRPLLGCAVFPYSLVTIDCEGSVIEIPLRRIELIPFELFSEEGKESKMDSPLFEQIRKPFIDEIEQMLQEARVLPRLSLPTQDVLKGNVLDMIVTMANLVRKTTIPKFRKIRSILAHRVLLIRAMQKLQLSELADLEADRLTIQDTAERFAERVENIAETMETQKDRLQKIIKRVAELSPSPTDAELQMDVKITEIESKIEGYHTDLNKLRKSRAYQTLKICEREEEEKEIALSNKQTTIIRNYLSVVGEDIAKLVHEVNTLKSTTGIASD